MATTFTRVNDSGSDAGAATRITLNELGFFTLSAVRTGAGNLKLIGWSTGGDKVSRLADSKNQAREVSEIAMTRNLNRTVTAVRTGSGILRLISWNDNSDLSNITRLKDSGGDAGEATQIAISRFSTSRYVTAVRTGSGRLKLIAWDVDTLSGEVTRTGDSENQPAGHVSEVALVTPSNRLVTAVRDGGGNLKVITWDMQN